MGIGIRFLNWIISVLTWLRILKKPLANANPGDLYDSRIVHRDATHEFELVVGDTMVEHIPQLMSSRVEVNQAIADRERAEADLARSLAYTARVRADAEKHNKEERRARARARRRRVYLRAFGRRVRGAGIRVGEFFKKHAKAILVTTAAVGFLVIGYRSRSSLSSVLFFLGKVALNVLFFLGHVAMSVLQYWKWMVAFVFIAVTVYGLLRIPKSAWRQIGRGLGSAFGFVIGHPKVLGAIALAAGLYFFGGRLFRFIYGSRYTKYALLLAAVIGVIMIYRKLTAHYRHLRITAVHRRLRAIPAVSRNYRRIIGLAVFMALVVVSAIGVKTHGNGLTFLPMAFWPWCFWNKSAFAKAIGLLIVIGWGGGWLAAIL